MTPGKTNIYFQFYFWLLIYIAISLPLSKYTMSMGSMLLFVLWLMDDFQGNVALRFFRQKGLVWGISPFLAYVWQLTKQNFNEKFNRFLHNKAAVIFASIYFMHIAGLFFTANFAYGMKDLKVKFPLLFFPIIFSGMPKLDYHRFRRLLLYYLVAIFIGTLYSSYLLMRGNFLDIRDISPFISSIRFGLNISFGFFILLYFIVADHHFNQKQKISMGLMALWFLIFLSLMESITSLSIILIIGVSYLIFILFKSRNLVLKSALLILIIAVPSFLYLYVKDVVHEANTVILPKTHPDKLTALGNSYTFDTVNQGVEDGKYVGWYLCEPELKKAWNERSTMNYNGIDKQGNELRETLMRYLTSKNLRKDAAGVAALTSRDINWIENGVANYNYLKHPGLRSRILKILKGYQVYKSTGNPSGNSLMQRIEYTKASLGIIKSNFWHGVGTGDLQDAFYGEFSAMHSQLSPKFMFHAHNQYLAIFVAFGIFGLLIFLFALIYPVLITHAYRDYFFVVFYLIMLISMLSDDTLETHAGAMLFAFFTSLILFGKQRKNAG